MDMSKKSKKRRRRKLSTSSSENDREDMSKKSKKRKYRKRSTSSSEDDRETSTNKTDTTKRKYVLSSTKEKKDTTVHKTKDYHSSRKDEGQSQRHFKKPVSRLEKTKSTREESPIFKDEESKNCKKSDKKSSKDSSSKTSSRDKLKAERRDILLPRPVSVSHKVEHQNKPTRRSRWDVLPTASDKSTDGKKPYPVPKDALTPTTIEPTKQTHPKHSQEDLKTKFKSKILTIVTSKETPTATQTKLKTSTKNVPLQQDKSLKESTIVPSLSPFKKTVVPEKSSEDKKIWQPFSSTTKTSDQNVKKQDSTPAFRNSFSPLCQTDSASSQTLNVLSNFKIPSLNVKTVVEEKSATDKNKTVKSDNKTVPVSHADLSSWKMPFTETAKLKTVPKVSLAQQRKILKGSTILKFKIPKKTVVAETLVKETTRPTRSDRTPSTLKPAPSVTEQSLRSSSSVTMCPNQNVQKQDPWPSSVSSLASLADPTPLQDQLAEELHQARSEKLLEVDVTQRYGELTCMEIDPPEEGAIDTDCKQQPERDLIIVLDTNILLSHLDYVKNIVSRGLKVNLPVVLIPWVVLQELDSLKKGNSFSGSVAKMAIPAIAYIHNSLKDKRSRLWGQSMQQAAESSKGLNAENNDDRVLQCCLQFQRLHPECAVILCTNDKNLCSKALVSGVKAFTKNDLETEVATSSLGSSLLQNVQTCTTAAQVRHSISTLMPSNVNAQAQEGHSPEETRISLEKGNNQLDKVSAGSRRNWHLERLVYEFESCLQEALSDVLEAEMKAAYDDLWLEIVYRKPPWSIADVLHCMKKHWIAVFGQVVQRAKQQNVLNLIEFFTSGKAVDHNSTLEVLLEAKDLLKEFEKRSSLVPRAISVIDNILNTFETQGETSAEDVVMKEAEEDKQPTSLQVSHSDVWAFFVNIWDRVSQASLSVFKALDFDLNASASVLPAGSPPPPQDVLLCLDQLVCTVSQLLQAFSSVLTSPGLVEAQSLLSLMQSLQIVDLDKLTATDLLNCFSQQEYSAILENNMGSLGYFLYDNRFIASKWLRTPGIINLDYL